MTGLAALTPLEGLRLDTTEEVGGDNNQGQSSQFASGLELKHWKEMVENPRRPIVHWHVLKVRVSHL